MGRPALSLYISQGAQTKKVVGSQWPINCLSWWCSVQEGERKRQSGEIVQYALVVSKSNCPLQHWQGISQLERRSQFPWVLPFIGYISCSGTLERDLHVPDSYHFYKNRKRSWRLEMFLSIFLVNLASKTLSAFLPCVVSEINNSGVSPLLCLLSLSQHCPPQFATLTGKLFIWRTSNVLLSHLLTMEVVSWPLSHLGNIHFLQ